jgi:hypothetical protein
VDEWFLPSREATTSRASLTASRCAVKRCSAIRSLPSVQPASPQIQLPLQASEKPNWLTLTTGLALASTTTAFLTEMEKSPWEGEKFARTLLKKIAHANLFLFTRVHYIYFLF